MAQTTPHATVSVQSGETFGIPGQCPVLMGFTYLTARFTPAESGTSQEPRQMPRHKKTKGLSLASVRRHPAPQRRYPATPVATVTTLDAGELRSRSASYGRLPQPYSHARELRCIRPVSRRNSLRIMETKMERSRSERRWPKLPRTPLFRFSQERHSGIPGQCPLAATQTTHGFHVPYGPLHTSRIRHVAGTEADAATQKN